LGIISAGFVRRSRALQQLVDALGEFLNTEAENLNVIAQTGDRLQLFVHCFELRGKVWNPFCRVPLPRDENRRADYDCVTPVPLLPEIQQELPVRFSLPERVNSCADGPG
jgi:hypothetical protein